MEEFYQILFLKNIKKNDYIEIENIFYNEMMEKIDLNNVNNNKNIVIYKKIPDVFVDNESWIKNTNLKCWYCDLTFNNSPYFIPKEYYKISNKHEMKVYGNFCSVGCSKAFLNSNVEFLKDDSYWEKNALLILLHELKTKKRINIITPSISKYNLNIYGGHMTLKEYRNKLIEINLKNN